MASAITPAVRGPADRAAVAAGCAWHPQKPVGDEPGSPCPRAWRFDGDPNAQIEDQVRGQEAVSPDRERQGHLDPGQQAPWDDQADQQADPPAARHDDHVASGRADRQKMDAVRLTTIHLARSLSWPASSEASPPMPSTKRS